MTEQAAWTREMPWRQGQVLPRHALQALLPDAADDDCRCAVVISHDCDLATDNLQVEPDVEVIVGSLVAASNGNYLHGKAPRTLHLEYSRRGLPVFIELIATRKKLVPKQSLAAYAPDEAFALSSTNRDVLRSWLAARYRRAALSDAFDRCMKRLKVDERIVRVTGRYGEVVSAVYFDINEGNEPVEADGNYRLTIVLAYVEGDEPEEAAEKVEKAADELLTDLKGRLCRDGVWTGIQVVDCYAISEETLRVAQAKRFTEFRLEYMSLREEPEHPKPFSG